MNRQQASEFIHALNMLQPHVAPLFFDKITGTEAVRTIVAVANGQAVCDVKSASEYVESVPQR